MFMTPFESRFNIALLHTLSLYHCKSVREEKPSIARKVNCLSIARVAHGVASASSASYCISATMHDPASASSTAAPSVAIFEFFAAAASLLPSLSCPVPLLSHEQS